MQAGTTWDDLLHPGKATDFFLRRPFPPFDPTTSEYNTANALWLAELSRLAYRDPPNPQSPKDVFPASAAFIRHLFFSSAETGTQAMLTEFGGPSPFAVLAFRGTEETPTDFITVLKIGAPPLTQGKIDVHDGFAEALDSVWHDIDAALTQLSCPAFYTGHSLGAALATLAAARRASRAVYTFGSPRVGNLAFASSLATVRVHRVVNDEDMIATVPPIALGFTHVGTEQRLSAPRRKPPLSFSAPPKALADHAPVNYVDRI